MDSPCIKQTVCNVLNRFQREKYLVAYVLKTNKVCLPVTKPLFQVFIIIMVRKSTKPVFRVSVKQVSNQSPHLQRQAKKLKILPIASLHMILLKKRITKALIRLRGCAGWSASGLFANPQRQVSRVLAHIISLFYHFYE